MFAPSRDSGAYLCLASTSGACGVRSRPSVACGAYSRLRTWRWCGEHGIVSFVLRYRLMREDEDGNSIGYTRDDALEDAITAMK